jgi:MFS transporter, ACS family, D-galactonate transporter
MPKSEPQRGAWMIVALLFLFMFINFADKVVLGLAGVPIMRDLNLSPKEFGLVASSFFLLFSASAVVTGFIVNRIETRWALAVMGLIWALTQFPLLGSVGMMSLIACRIVLGAGEGPAYPVALHAAYKWFPNEQRTLPTAVIAQGAAIGVILVVPGLDWVIEHVSWHWAFGTLGFLGLAWVALWLAFAREGSVPVTIADRSGRAVARVPYGALLTCPTVWAAFAAGFGAYWGLSLLVAWFTPFLVKGLGYSQYWASWITTLPWAMSVVIVLGVGWLSQAMLARGVSTRVARGILGGGAVALGGAALLATPFAPEAWMKVALITLGMSLPAVIYVMGHAIVSEFTPLPQRGAMLGINNAIATLAGALAPISMGSVVQNAATAAEGYGRGFLICGAVTLAGGLIGMAFLRPADEIHRFAAAPQRRVVTAM